MVYGREIDGEETTFGTTGYTFNNTFVLYDRKTTSVWYPLHDGRISAIAGELKGDALPFIQKPPIMTLGEWRDQHPDTRVLVDGPIAAPAGDQPQGPQPPSN